MNAPAPDTSGRYECEWAETTQNHPLPHPTPTPSATHITSHTERRHTPHPHPTPPATTSLHAGTEESGAGRPVPPSPPVTSLPHTQNVASGASRSRRSRDLTRPRSEVRGQRRVVSGAQTRWAGKGSVCHLSTADTEDRREGPRRGQPVTRGERAVAGPRPGSTWQERLIR